MLHGKKSFIYIEMFPTVTIYYQIVLLKQQLVCQGHMTKNRLVTKMPRKPSILNYWPCPSPTHISQTNNDRAPKWQISDILHEAHRTEETCYLCARNGVSATLFKPAPKIICRGTFCVSCKTQWSIVQEISCITAHGAKYYLQRPLTPVYSVLLWREQNLECPCSDV